MYNNNIVDSHQACALDMFVIMCYEKSREKFADKNYTHNNRMPTHRIHNIRNIKSLIKSKWIRRKTTCKIAESTECLSKH